MVYGGLNHLRCKLAIKIIDELIACFIVVVYEASLVLNAHGDGRVIGISDICNQDNIFDYCPWSITAYCTGTDSGYQLTIGLLMKGWHIKRGYGNRFLVDNGAAAGS